MKVRDVREYALRHVVSPEFAEDRVALEAFMRADIVERLKREGDYTIVPDSFNLQVIPRTTIEGRSILTEQEEAAGLTGDELLARMTVRCY